MIADWLQAAKQRLNGTLADDSSLSAQVLLGHMLGRPRAWLLAHPETVLDDDQQSHLQTALDRLTAGTPLPYLTGHQAFYGLDLEVTPDVLIPRPETELLVDQAVSWLSRQCPLAQDSGGLLRAIHYGRRHAARRGSAIQDEFHPAIQLLQHLSGG